MARLPRLALDGAAHLVVLRGLPGQQVFTDDVDRAAFVAALREAVVPQRVTVEAYTLADDHVHLLLRPARGAALGVAMQALGRRYVAAFNRRHQRSGPLWAGRYRAAPLQPGSTVLQAMVFIDGHGQRAAGAAADHASAPAEPWSSRAHHQGRRRDPLVGEGPDWWSLGNTPFEREAAYRRLMDDGLAPERLRALADASHKGWPMGDAAWLAGLARDADRPVRPRPRGRAPRAPTA